MDVTERKRIETERREVRSTAGEATRSKSMFPANMSHEVRAPMNAIIGLFGSCARFALLGREARLQHEML